MKRRGIDSSLEQLKAEISERDRADSEREVSPLMTSGRCRFDRYDINVN